MTLRKAFSGPGRLGAWLTAGVFLLLVAACGQHYPQSTLTPQTDFAKISDDVFMTTVKWAVVVFVLVEGALLLAIFRFRGKDGDPEPKQVHGNTMVEVVWTIIPAMILAFIAVPTIKGIFKSAEVPGGAVRVEVIGHQWWWEFRYPDLQVVTANEMIVPAGRKVALYMTTADVVHSFWVPQLAGKRDVFPRRANTIWFTAPDTGNFSGQCAEFCGEQHGRMGFRVLVKSPGDFDAWVSNQQVGSPLINGGVVPRDTTQPADSVMVKGQQVFLSAGCIGCHAMVGTPMAGQVGMVGPNLSHVGSRTTLVANLMPNTPENMARWLRDPQKVKQGSLMKLPRQLTEDEIATLVAYLEAHK